MARNLLKAGHKVLVFDRSKDAVASLVCDGATAAKSVTQLATTPGRGRDWAEWSNTDADESIRF